MAKIIRYKLESPVSNDETFQVTRILKTVTTQTAETVQETDENGNIISARVPRTGNITNGNIPEIKTNQEIHEGIKAIGLPSGAVAKVTILETSDGVTPEGLEEMQDGRNRSPVVDMNNIK